MTQQSWSSVYTLAGHDRNKTISFLILMECTWNNIMIRIGVLLIISSLLRR